MNTQKFTHTTIIEAEAEAIAEDTRRIAEEENREHNLGILSKRLASDVPALFQGTDRKHPAFNRDRFDAIGKFQPTPEKPWLGLIGTPGKCKSRIAYLLAEDYLRSITSGKSVPSFEFATGYEITSAVSQLHDYRKDTPAQRSLWDEEIQTFAQKARAYLNRFQTADLVLIDDIGKGGMAQAVSTEMLAIIDTRYSRQSPTIWTSNVDPSEIAAGMRGEFTEDMKGPFAGRLVESSKIYQFK